MNRRVLTILLLAFVIAGGCAFVVYHLVVNRMSATKAVASTRVVAAATDIKLGAVLNSADLATVEIVGPLPTGAILEKDKGNAIGRGVLEDIYKGEAILDARLAPIGSGGGLAATIPQGMRAAAVRVDDIIGVSGFATPGMRVDVLISGLPPGVNGQAVQAEKGTLVKTLLQDIQVLSAGTDIQKDAEGKAHPVQVVNLLVTPEQAETLSLATSQAKIQLVLRNPLDTKTDPVPGTAMVNLFADQLAVAPRQHVVQKAAKPKAPAPFAIEVINGTKHSEEKFSTPGGQQ
ncbi:MAG: Flp pilus assembly protein CpaB [Terracidiphilus sp.]|jgi:pilus assembly protein CpaB